MKDRSIAPVAQNVLMMFRASSLMQSIFLVSLPAAVGLIIGPVISFSSDRHRGRLGRRIPYLIATTPIAVLAMIGLGFSPAIGRYLHHALSSPHGGSNEIILISFGLFWSLFEISTVAANAVFGALVNDVVPQQFLGRFYGLFRALSLIAAIVFNKFLIGYAKTHYSLLFIGVGLIYGIGVSLMIATVKEGKYPLVVTSDAEHYRGLWGQARLYLKECFSNRYYVWVTFALVVSALAFLPVNTFSQPYAVSLHFSLKTYGNYLAETYAISLCLTFGLGYLADRFHPLRLGIASMAIYGLVAIAGGVYSADARFFPVVFVAHGVLSGVFFTGTASLGQRLFPKLRYAQFASAAGMAGAVASMIFAPVVGKYLDFTGHLYRLTFLMDGALAVFAVALLLMVYSKFIALGGDQAYVAPS